MAAHKAAMGDGAPRGSATRTVREMRAFCAGRSPNDIAATLARAFLVQEEEFTPDQRPRWLAFNTVSQQRLEVIPPAVKLPGSFTVFPVPERGSAPYPDRITVGRSSTSVICILQESVSKLHAFFVRVDGSFALFDAKSRNGTRVNGKWVPSYDAGEGPTVLRSHDQVRFGVTSFRFLSAADVAEFLERCVTL